MKKKVKKKEFKLSDIVEEEIKQNSLRQGFSKNLIEYTNNLVKKKNLIIKTLLRFLLLQLMEKIVKITMMQFGRKIIRKKQK